MRRGNFVRALGALIESKPPGSEHRARLVRFSKEKALEPILKVVLLETRPDQLLKVLTAGIVHQLVSAARAKLLRRHELAALAATLHA